MAAPSVQPSVTVGYWGIRGLGAPLRMLCMYKGVPFRNVCYDLVEKPEGGWATDWWEKKAELKKRNPLINLPYVIDGDMVVAQSNACLAHLGRKYGAWGTNDADIAMCEQLLCEIMDLRNKMSAFAYSGTKDVAGDAKALLEGVASANGIFPKLEACLALNQDRGGGKFLVSDHATAPDFHLWEMLEQYTALAAAYSLPSPLADCPLLAAFHAKFGALPENAKYLASPLYNKLPFNNKMAVFGSAPGGATYQRGQAVDWHGLTGDF